MVLVNILYDLNPKAKVNGEKFDQVFAMLYHRLQSSFKLFFSILTAFHSLTSHVILFVLCNVKLQLYSKGLAWS